MAQQEDEETVDDQRKEPDRQTVQWEEQMKQERTQQRIQQRQDQPQFQYQDVNRHIICRCQGDSFYPAAAGKKADRIEKPVSDQVK